MQGKCTPASNIALGGVLAALALVIMSMGTLIPIATYVCPMLCILILKGVVRTCGKRIGWAWFGAVAILSLLLAPDKEAAAVFCVIGYYPIVKPAIDKKKLPWLRKGLLFNASILTLYAMLLYVLGMEQILQEFEGAGIALTAVTLILGNVTFFMMDRLLEMRIKR